MEGACSAAQMSSTTYHIMFDVFTFFGGILFATVVAIACYLTYTFSQQRFSAMQTAADASTWPPDAFRKAFTRSHGGLPSLFLRPDMDRASFLNDAMHTLWPRIERAAVAWAFENRNLETLLNSQSFWKPSWLAASGIVLQSLILGQEPPKVTGVKIYTPSNADGPTDALVADVSFDWASKMMVQMAMKTLDGGQLSFIDRALALVYRGIGVKVVLRNLIARGHLRIEAGPLLNQLPVVGAVRVSFLEPPATSYQVSSFGANPLMIPGLEAWLNAFIANTVLEPFTFPEGFTLDVAQLFGMASGVAPQRPEGLLTVIVHSATAVPRMDLIGGCDPYVKIRMAKMKQRTAVKSSTLNPVWEEEFEFLVYDKQHQQLTLELWDSDALRPDDLIGSVEVQLKELDLRPNHANDLKLIVPKVGKATKKYNNDDARRTTASAGQSRGTTASAATPGRIAAASGATETLTATRPAHGIGTTFHDAPRVTVQHMQHAFAKLTSGPAQTELDVTVGFFPFTSAEVNAAVNAGQGGDAAVAFASVSLNSRITRIVRGGMLYVRVIRGEMPSTKAAVTKTYRLKIDVGPRGGPPVYHKTWERSGLGRGLSGQHPVFDCEVDFLLDGDVAHAGDAVVSVSVYVTHFIRRPSFKGVATVPLARAVAARQVHDELYLEGPKGGGRLEVALEWLGMLETM